MKTPPHHHHVEISLARLEREFLALLKRHSAMVDRFSRVLEEASKKLTAADASWPEVASGLRLQRQQLISMERQLQAIKKIPQGSEVEPLPAIPEVKKPFSGLRLVRAS